ncbi:MAG: hypothetical protein GY866_42080 [Proteobacteria bacterium]|nr:hypothetical protein [Pseudomonadota bacterium]
MKTIAEYREDIHSLAAQLEKLLKVIRHSDPSAEELKHLLHQKYHRNLTVLAKNLKARFLWDDLRNYILNLKRDKDLKISGDNKETILKKLLKDFEGEFVSKQVLMEFSAPDPRIIQKRVEARRRLKEEKERREREEQERREREEKAKHQASTTEYSKESIMDMVQTTQKQRNARANLQKMIDAINRLDPQKLETRINQLAKVREKS